MTRTKPFAPSSSFFFQPTTSISTISRIGKMRRTHHYLVVYTFSFLLLRASLIVSHPSNYPSTHQFSNEPIKPKLWCEWEGHQCDAPIIVCDLFCRRGLLDCLIAWLFNSDTTNVSQQAAAGAQRGAAQRTLLYCSLAAGASTATRKATR